MIRCDALIAGGGPAGLAAAIALRQKGLKVVVADSLQPPIDKACGEGLMPDAREDLAALGISITDQHGAAFDGIAFISGRYQAAAPFERGSGIGIRRLELHSLLVDRCREIGVQLAWGSRVCIAGSEPLRLDSQSCVYGYAIGADGQSSRLRQAVGLNRGRVMSRRFGARCHYRAKPWSRMVEVHWGRLGQAYITPVGPEEICIATVSRDPAMRMDAVLAGLPVVRAHLGGAGVLSRPRGGLTSTHTLSRVTAGNVALVGDASGSADAITGEGIGLSFRQALLLAEAVAVDNLAIYEAGHPKIQQKPHLMSRAMLRMDAWPWLRAGVMTLLSGHPPLFAHLLSFHLDEISLFGTKANDIEKNRWHHHSIGHPEHPVRTGAGPDFQSRSRPRANPDSLEAERVTHHARDVQA
jgi:flavin-dependent dehydrogenase